MARPCYPVVCVVLCLRSSQCGHPVALALVDGNSLKLPGCPLSGSILFTYQHVRWSLQVRQYLCCRCFTASASQVTSLVLLSVAEAVCVAAPVFSPSGSHDCSPPCAPSNTLLSAICVSGRPPPPPTSCLRLIRLSRLCLSLRHIPCTPPCLVSLSLGLVLIRLRLCGPRFEPSLHLCLVRVPCTLAPTPRPMYARLTYALVHAPRISYVLLATAPCVASLRPRARPRPHRDLRLMCSCIPRVPPLRASRSLYVYSTILYMSPPVVE